MTYRVTLAFDVEAGSDAEAVELAVLARVTVAGEAIGAEVVTVEDENFNEVG